MQYDIISTIVMSLVLAFICGMTAKKLRFPAILGYIVAGIVVGPFTPGFVADASIAKELAEIGIILLMFGVGLHFSLADLLQVRKIALPGALFQMLVATLIGALITTAMGYSLVKGLVYGFALSVASTVVLLRSLEQRGALDTETGKIAVGWLIVEDIAMVLALVFLPIVAEATVAGNDVSSGVVFKKFLEVLLKIGGFAVLMIVVGQKFLPGLLVLIAKTKSNELTTLGTLSIALGFAYLAYTVFDASFALGAFLAGLVLSESEIGHKAAEKALPMRDAFAVLFFVSVGMLFDPMTLVNSPLMVLATLFIIVVGKSAAALAITYLFRQPRKTSYTIAISLAQIGEFSFILAGDALTKGLLDKEFYNLLLSGALISIALNPFLFKCLDNHLAKEAADPPPSPSPT